MTVGEDLRVESPGRFKIVNCTAQIDRTETCVRETLSTLNYITPHFRAEAEVELSLEEEDVYTVGWVQAVTAMKFYNTYPAGQSSWEIQELNTGETEAVSDADGRQYPWYGVTTECVTVRGPCQHVCVRVGMNDNFSPTVSWAIPVGRDQPDTLQRVHRDQSFTAWLVVKNERTDSIRALKAYRWSAVINIAVDCSKSVGHRASLLDPTIQEQPEELEHYPLPQSALYAPRANEAQKFVWRTLESELIFEVTCTPSGKQSPPAEIKQPMRYVPY
eukprot:Em0016g272a